MHVVSQSFKATDELILVIVLLEAHHLNGEKNLTIKKKHQHSIHNETNNFA